MKKDWADIRIIRRYVADFRCKLGPQFVFTSMSWETIYKIANRAPRNNVLFFQEWIWPLEARWLSLRWNGATGCGVIESPWWPCGPINLSFRRWSAVMQCIVLQGRLSCFMGIFCHGWSSHHILSWHPKLWYYSCPSMMRFFLTWLAWITLHLEAMMKRCFVQEKEGEMVMDRSGKLDFSLRLVFGDDEPWREALIRGINRYHKCS